VGYNVEMDVSVLVAVLAPCLGGFLGAINAAASGVGESVGAELVEHAKRLWAKLRPRLEAKPAALEAAEDVARRPDDPRARGALELQLEKLLAEDPGLSREIESLLRDAVAAGVVATGERNVAVGGDVSGVIITGDNAVMRD
jgi:hypothetical protein